MCRYAGGRGAYGAAGVYCSAHCPAVSADGHGVAELAVAVAKTHDPGLLKFLALAVPEWLPVEHRLHRADRTAGRGGHCKLCRTGAGDARLAETVRHLFVCQCPELRGALERLIADGCTALVDAGVRVRGPCQSPPVDGFGSALPPGCRTRWVRVWFDPRRLFWMEVVVRDEYDVVDYDRRDPLGAVLGVLPRCLDRLMACHALPVAMAGSAAVYGRRGSCVGAYRSYCFGAPGGYTGLVAGLWTVGGVRRPGVRTGTPLPRVRLVERCDGRAAARRGHMTCLS